MGSHSFEPINFKKLSEVVEGHIRDLILRGEIEPGERLPRESEIGRQFGVSLVTVREALKGLETYGLIEKKKGKGGGIFVSTLRSEAVKVPLFHFLRQKHFSARDLSELRMIIEPAASRLAAVRAAEEKVVELEANIGRCEALVEGAGAEFSEDHFFTLEKGNIEFHRLIGEATGNPVLVHTVDYLLDFLFHFKRMTLIPNLQFSEGVIRDHRLVLSRLKERDGRAAEEAMISHLRYVEGYLTEKEGEKSVRLTGSGGGGVVG